MDADKRAANTAANTAKRNAWSQKTGISLSVSMQVDTKGFEARIFNALGPVAQKRMVSFMDGVVRTAKALSPRQTGHNASTITHDVFVDGKMIAGERSYDSSDLDMVRNKSISARVYTQSGYGGYLELGTARMKARPYIFPAFNQQASRLKSLLDKAANNG